MSENINGNFKEGGQKDSKPLQRESWKGRGAAHNPGTRFEAIQAQPFEGDDPLPEDPNRPKTQFFRDLTRTILTRNQSPDVGFTVSINPYRGCEHGCIYCYARPTHEYLNLSAGLDFETKILVKEEAAHLLEQELRRKAYRPEVIALSGVTDPYQPAERKRELTRQCLSVLTRFKNPVFIVTKNALVCRDLDLLSELAQVRASAVLISLTTLDDELCGKLEPRTSRPVARLRTIQRLKEAGIPVGVNIAPVIPGLTDHEIPSLLKEAGKAGAQFAGFTIVRLPLSVGPLFEDWLSRHFPERKDKVLHRIESLRGGKLNDPRFGSRMRGEGVWAEQIASLFKIARKQAGLASAFPSLSVEAFQVPEIEGPQLTLF